MGIFSFLTERDWSRNSCEIVAMAFHRHPRENRRSPFNRGWPRNIYVGLVYFGYILDWEYICLVDRIKERLGNRNKCVFECYYLSSNSILDELSAIVFSKQKQTMCINFFVAG